MSLNREHTASARAASPRTSIEIMVPKPRK
jgi:hypothetical protein